MIGNEFFADFRMIPLFIPCSGYLALMFSGMRSQLDIVGVLLCFSRGVSGSGHVGGLGHNNHQ